MRLRALVLAAGHGSRLRPLTDAVPKPLLPVAGRPILVWTLDRLAGVGCEAVAINLHHEGEQIRQAVGRTYSEMTIHYSEEERLLGTLGALGRLREFLSAADLILVVNGDSLCRWPLHRLVRRHQRRNAQATLLLTRRPDPLAYGGGVGIDREDRVISLYAGDEERGRVEHRFVFAGAHVLSPSLLPRVEERPADFITDLYLPLLGEGARLVGVPTGRRWHDLGTPRRYLAGALDWGRGPLPGRLWRHTWVARGALVDGRSQLRQCSVEREARVEAEARLERVVLLPGGRVGRGSVVREAIVGFGAVLPAGTWVTRRMIMPQRKGVRPEPGDTVVGGMIYRPLDKPGEESGGGGSRGERLPSVGGAQPRRPAEDLRGGG